MGGCDQASGDQEDKQEPNTAINQPLPSLLAAIPVHICLLKV
jgi:hypothetical protein